MDKWYEFTGFSDEIDADIDVQFQHLNRLGIRYFEPRGISGKNIADLTPEEAVSLKEKMEHYGISVSSIGSPIGKIQITDPMEPHLEKLRQVIRTAGILGTRYIRIFSFYIPDGRYEEFREEVMDRMKAMEAVAREEDVILLHENEKGIYGDNAARCRDIQLTVASPYLKAVFDPANFVQCHQETFPEGWELMKDFVVYMHIKDSSWKDGSIVPPGYGDGHIEDLCRALKAHGYRGFFSLEPHLGYFTGLDMLSEEDSNALKASSVAGSGPARFELAYNALKTILERT